MTSDFTSEIKKQAKVVKEPAIFYASTIDFNYDFQQFYQEIEKAKRQVNKRKGSKKGRRH